MLVGCLRGEADIEIIGEASDAFTAHDLIARRHPDLITLDIEMPKMDGLSFLRQLMKRRPVPVIIISSHVPPGSISTLEALRAGAVDVISKPQTPMLVADLGRRLKQTIRELRKCSMHLRPLPLRHRIVPTPQTANRTAGGLIAIGASAGGPQALEVLLTHIPADTSPIVIVQHMPAPFIPLLAERLNEVCPMRVVVARAHEELSCGTAYFAPGDHHLIVEHAGGRLQTGLRRSPAVNRQRPAVDVLFHSAAPIRAVPVVGVLLTGMGRDGADGMLALRRAGHETIAEDPRSCVVFGMPREAIENGGARHVLTLDQMPARILRSLRAPRSDNAERD